MISSSWLFGVGGAGVGGGSGGGGAGGRSGGGGGDGGGGAKAFVSKAAKSVSAPGRAAIEKRAAVRSFVAGSPPISEAEPSTIPVSTQPVPNGTPVPSRGAGGMPNRGGGGEGAGVEAT